MKLRRGRAARKDRITVSEYLDMWLPAHAATKDLKASTVNSYVEKIDGHIKPRIGGTRLQLLTSDQVQGLYMDILNEGFSRRTAEYVGTILRMALKHAVTQYQYLDANPAENIPIPRPRKSVTDSWNSDEIKRILVTIQRDRYGPMFYLQALTGARRGELLALRWSHIDLTEGVVRFSLNRVRLKGGYQEYTLKNDKPKSVTIDEVTVAMLREHKKRQAEDKLKSRKWLDEDYVFCNRNGGPLNPSNMHREWKKLIEVAAVRYQKPHALRHTHATLLLEAGVPLHVVAERLGHKDAMVTATVYAHVTQAQSRQASETFSKLLAN